jgi:diketogulonate reductase-like aldo/keto reductase
MRTGNVLAIPKASTAEHVQENVASRDLHLSDTNLERLDRVCPAPTRPQPLEML